MARVLSATARQVEEVFYKSQRQPIRVSELLKQIVNNKNHINDSCQQGSFKHLDPVMEV